MKELLAATLKLIILFATIILLLPMVVLLFLPVLTFNGVMWAWNAKDDVGGMLVITVGIALYIAALVLAGEIYLLRILLF